MEVLQYFLLFFQIRLVVEEGLNQLPYKNCEVTTPTGKPRVTMVREKYLVNEIFFRSGKNQGILWMAREI